MDKLIRFLGRACLIVILFVIVSAPILFLKGRSLNKESREFIKKTVVPIISKWDEGKFLENCTDELKEQMEEDGGAENLFVRYRKLGKLKLYKGCEGKAKVSLSTENGRNIKAAYVLDAEYEAAAATIDVNLVKRGSSWQIHFFDVKTEIAESEPNTSGEIKTVQDSDIVVKGILYSDKGSSVVINDEILTEGDIISEATIIKIEKDRVLFEKNGGKFYIPVKSAEKEEKRGTRKR